MHVAGVQKFLRIAEAAGWRAVFLGPAVPVQQVLQIARQEKADLVGVSYRLTPETGERLLATFAEQADELRSAGVRFAFAGTPQLAGRACAMGFFERVFEGGEPAEEVLAYLKGQSVPDKVVSVFPQSTIERIAWKQPYPLIRHHFGLPTLEETRQGIEQIAIAQVLDVISLGIDQDAQENFYHPERQDPRRRGAGGVPVRAPEDYRLLFAASRCGNYPLMRTYSGTDDFTRLAEMYVETMNISWCAVPLFWFNRMDGRGPWSLEGSIREHQKLMTWYGSKEIPVELNEPHHWGMRDAADVIFVVSGYLSAYNARSFGVHDYIAQMMFNSPPGMSDAMDLAKMLAILDLIEPLVEPGFRIWRQTRSGLLSYPLDPAEARGHLAASVYVQMTLKPHILHVVGHTEAHHAATAGDVIESCKIARRSVENAIRSQLDLTTGTHLQERRVELVQQAQVTLSAIRALAGSENLDPFTDPACLAKAVTTGILDAPHLGHNPYARGIAVTRVNQYGACVAVDPETGRVLGEEERIAKLGLHL